MNGNCEKDGGRRSKHTNKRQYKIKGGAADRRRSGGVCEVEGVIFSA
jgi:hypothetical protein